MTRYDAAQDFLGQKSAESILDRLRFIKRTFSRVLFIGQSTNLIASLKSMGHVLDPPIHIPFLRNDDLLQHLPPDIQWGQIDLIVCNLNLQWVNDLPGLLWQIRQLLKPDGLFLGSLLGGDTLCELKECFMKAEMQLYAGMSPRVVPMVDLYTASQLLLRAQFTLPVADREVVRARYKNVIHLMKDLRKMALTNIMYARHKGYMSRNLLSLLEQIYRNNFTTKDNGLQLTYELIYLTGWAEHESQQKALRPGSGKINLTTALGG